ncbi:MAG: cellulase family glycosylhydrolase [Lentisphaeria bacterium]|nr:cellulase family glycosylhydrolase [Lentisphaeria bacterium]
MNIFCKMFLGAAVLGAAVLQAGGIVPEKLVLDGNSKKSVEGYVVRMPKRKSLPNTTTGITYKPEMKQIAGKIVVFSADMRYNDVGSDAQGSHVGGKILITYKGGDGRMRFLASPSVTGTDTEWKKHSFTLEVPADARDFRVVFGLQQSWGTLEVRKPDMTLLSFGPAAGEVKTAFPENVFALGRHSKFKDGILTVKVPKQVPMPNETLGATVVLNLGNMREKVIAVRGKVRYDVASDVNGAHIGAKVLSFRYDLRGGGKPSWVGSEPLVGKSEEWQEFCAYIPIQDSTSEVRLTFGMQQAWGKAEFRDLSLEIVAPVDGTPGYQIQKGFKCEYSPAVLNAAPRRGFMTPVPGLIKADDIREMGKWNANLIRYQMIDGIAHCPENVPEYMKWLNNCLDKLDALMPVIKENNIKVIIDMHQVVGGRYNQGKRPPQNPQAELSRKLSGSSLHRVCCEEDMLLAFVEAWRMIARRYKDNPAIWGYDLMNEPCVIGPSPFHWADVQYEAAKAIREIDPETPILIEGNLSASALYFNMRPMPLKNIIYEIHPYYPGDYCFQGVYDKAYAQNYPKRAVRYTSNREQLREAMSRVIEFQKKYGAKIYVGEFTCVRWAPDGGGRYLDDLISIFEEYKWDWTFHAFREWDGFSPEHVGTPLKPEYGENERKATLLKYFKRNKQK